jgi:predicted DNA-binding transcriptional regulator AlpA
MNEEPGTDRRSVTWYESGIEAWPETLEKYDDC